MRSRASVDRSGMNGPHQSLLSTRPALTARTKRSVARGMTCSFVAVSALALGVPIASAASQAKPRPCPKPTGAQHSPQAVLYVVSDDDSLNTLVGCHKRTRRRTSLVSWYSQGSSTDDPAPQ